MSSQQSASDHSECYACGKSNDLTLVIASHDWYNQTPVGNGVDRALCQEHYEEALADETFHVREMPPETVERGGFRRIVRGNQVVLKEPDGEEQAWLKFRAGDELDLTRKYS